MLSEFLTTESIFTEVTESRVLKAGKGPGFEQERNLINEIINNKATNEQTDINNILLIFIGCLHT